MSDTNVHRVVGNLLVGTSHFFVDTTTNQVGINTSSPSASLDVATGDVKVGSGITLASSTGTITATGFSGDGSGLSGVNSDSGSWVNGSSSNIHLAVSTDNVGIGVLDPGYKLDVDGDINISSGSTLRVGGTPAVFSNWSVNGSDIYRSSGNVGIGTTSPQRLLHLKRSGAATFQRIQNVNNNNGCGIELMRGNTDTWGATAWSDWRINNTEHLDFGVKFTGTDFPSVLHLNNSGYVGIGTSTFVDSRAQLHIPSYGPSNINAGIAFQARTVTANSRNWRIATDDMADWGSLQFSVSDNNSSHPSSSSLHPVMTMLRNRNVGIGYGAPSQRFAVNGDAWINTQLYVIGKMGVGTNTPLAKLQVSGTGDVNIAPSNRQYFRWDYSNAFGSTSSNNIYGWGHCSIYASGAILSGDHVVSLDGTLNSSDERIKKNIVDADDAECLEVLRQLKPKKYQYKDEIKKGREPVWGFIAQEVRETLPYATKLRIDCIPNIYELANVSESSVITFTNFDTSTLGSTMVLRVIDKDDLEHFINIAEVVDEHTIRVEEDLSKWTDTIEESEGEKIFVFGQRVDDFIYLKKEAIWTVATAALQEVDRQLQAEKARNDALEARIAALEEHTHSDLEERLKADLQTTQTELAEERALHETTRTQLRNTQTELDVAKIKLLNIEARMQIIESNISKVSV